MPSEVSISSNALTKLGDEPITAFDDGTDRSDLCRDYYPNVRDAVLRAYPWSCATIQGELALSGDSPLFGYAYKFQLPVAPYCLRVLRVEDDVDYRIKGRFLYSDESSINIEYIARITDAGLFDSLLVEAIECRLAAELAYPITANPALVNTMWGLYEAKLREARTIDGMESPEDNWESNALVEVR
jgi:hypothetical protein